MAEEVLTDDQSHYEVSLTAGQAFLAFVLLLLSLAASFAFGLLLGRGQLDERLTARKSEPPTPVVAPVQRKEVAVKDDDFKPPVVTEDKAPSKPAFAQLLSTSDQKTAEGLAAKLIDGGFVSSYVERTTTDKGTVYRVRIKFPSEDEAKAAEPKLKTFSTDVWITR